MPTLTPTITVYHWILTVQLANGNAATANGTYRVTTPTTRAEIYQWALSGVCERIGTDDVTVGFFDLAPNDITVGSAS